ncbi:MAG: glycoside hydrolase family 15 protein [Actinobacteria bacterium]|nr:glycoside hydrolase family 15 protein [Actinomycetota bacterium]
MASRIEDYALIGDTHTTALVAANGSIDWLCVPRLDSGACFAALIGGDEHGRWRLAPAGDVRRIRRRYRDATLVLETDFETRDGAVRVVDFMPLRMQHCHLVRVVEGLSGSVSMSMELILRFDYGAIVPWVRRVDDALVAVGGPDAICLRSPVALEGRDLTTVAEFRVEPGDRVPFVLSWFASHRPLPKAIDPDRALADTEKWWRRWSARCTYTGEWRGHVVRSLITLKSLIYRPTGGIVAAATTSLPEQIGAGRNWDYRFCWLRDATFTLYALMLAGFEDEAREWRDWLLRAVAGHPEQMQILYGAAGERRLTELELDWLPGYEGSVPVRIGNAAVDQFQLDVYGEVMDVLHQARAVGLRSAGPAWDLQRVLMDFLEGKWKEPDEGIWEVRGPRRHFVHSKIMAWVALDRAVKAVERFGLDGPVERWRRVRAEIHTEVCDRGYDAGRQTFTQYYGGRELDASLLMMPLVGFLPATDGRVAGTVAAIERRLMRDGFVMRYSHEDAETIDGLPGGEGAFLACSFWLADCLSLLGRIDAARTLFMRLLGICNDVGLLSEEYDPSSGRLMGNFPQALSHLSLVNTAHNLSPGVGAARHRSGDAG